MRRLPTEIASLTERPGCLVLRGDGATMDDLRPTFVGRRQEHRRASFSVVVEVAGGGRGGLSLRYEERFHYDIERSPEGITARVRVPGIEQTWHAPVPDGTVRLTISCDPAGDRPDATGDPDTCDLVRLGFTTGTEVVTVAAVDGRFLSAETATSFTGRVGGMYAVDGVVRFSSFRYTGADD